MGTGNFDYRSEPVDVVGLGSGNTNITAGSHDAAWGGNYGQHTCAITAGGGVKCWGSNLFGQLGYATLNEWEGIVPKYVDSLSSGVSTSNAGYVSTCAVTTAGGVKYWGAENGSSPQDVATLTSGVASIASGASFYCALTTGGAVKCWGVGSSGQLGNGDNVDSPTPVNVTGLSSGVAMIEAGRSHVCAVTTAGAANSSTGPELRFQTTTW